MHTLKLIKPILDSEGNKTEELVFSFDDLKIEDIEKAEMLYFTFTQGLGEVVLYRCTTTFKLNLFFIACARHNKNLSYINFLNVKGQDKNNILRIVEKAFIPPQLIDKKKE